MFIICCKQCHLVSRSQQWLWQAHLLIARATNLRPELLWSEVFLERHLEEPGRKHERVKGMKCSAWLTVSGAVWVDWAGAAKERGSWAFFIRQAGNGQCRVCQDRKPDWAPVPFSPPNTTATSNPSASATMTMPPPLHLSITVLLHSQTAAHVSCFHSSLHPLVLYRPPVHYSGWTSLSSSSFTTCCRDGASKPPFIYSTKIVWKVGKHDIGTHFGQLPM